MRIWKRLLYNVLQFVHLNRWHVAILTAMSQYSRSDSFQLISRVSIGSDNGLSPIRHQGII